MSDPEAPMHMRSIPTIAAMCLSLLGGSASLARTETENTVAGSWGGYVRAAPSRTAKKVGSLAEGEHITILERTDTVWNGSPWFKIRMPNGTEGYQWGGIVCGIDQPIEGAFETCDWKPDK